MIFSLSRCIKLIPLEKDNENRYIKSCLKIEFLKDYWRTISEGFSVEKIIEISINFNEETTEFLDESI